MKKVFYDIITRYDIPDIDSYSMLLDYSKYVGMNSENQLASVTKDIAKTVWVAERNVIITDIKDHSFTDDA